MRHLLPLATALLGTLGLWLVDISDVVMRSGDRGVCNGLWCWNARVTWHMGLYLTITSIWVLYFLLLKRNK